jgi:signal transduction histidine kinase
VVYRRQLGGLELRTNRIISLYLFSILLLLISTFFIWFTTIRINDLRVEIAIEISLIFFTGIVAALIYPSFQRLIERRVLGIPLPPSQLVDAYAAKITTSLDSESLVTLLKDEILLSLLIRQSALLGVNGGNSSYILYSQEVAAEELPTQADIPNLIEWSNRYLSEGDTALLNPLDWIRLVLPMEAGGKLIGIWLLGRRDPDNYYAQSEINVLQTIANQTAIALINIAHTRLLHTLYQVDIERQEEERAALARGLHDEVLNQLAAIFMHQPSYNGVAPIEESEELITNYLREVISELRPAMLNYGLRPAIDELVDNLSQRVSGYPTFEVDLETDLVRFDPNVEQHVFRILQQACENALRHAHANCIRISGALKSDSINLTVDDDGLGFPSPGSQDLEQLLVQAHYGLVGMYERASIIGADLNIQSEHGKGTHVELIWPKSVQVGSPIINSVQAS